MKQVNLHDADLHHLLTLYETATVNHGIASEAGDYQSANNAAQTIISVYHELRARGLESQRALLDFLGHADIHVRVWAGAHALEFAPELGEPVLTEISRSGGLARLNAEMTLQEWKMGRLEFP